MLHRAKLAGLLFLLAVSLLAQQGAPRVPPVLQIQTLGPGAVELTGPWQFHLGDDMRWASPGFDDSGWEQIGAQSSWGSQTHPDTTGFAWYRRHLRIDRIAAGTDLALLMPPVDDAYEVYWNGELIGRYGSLPPRPRWHYDNLFHTLAVPSITSGTLAIRVWKSPLLFVDPGTLGGLNGPPMLGNAGAIAAKLAAIKSESTQQVLYNYTLVILYGFVTLLSLLLWSRNRKVKLFLWLAIFTVTPILLAVIQGLFTLPISYGWGRGLNQPIYALNHISLWFLLVWLLRLNGNRRLVRWTKWLATGTLAAGILDGALAFFWGGAGAAMQYADAVLTTIILVVEVFPFVIIGIGLRQRLEVSRWVVALSALVSQMIDTIADASAAGQRFTHWTFFETAHTPDRIFTVDQVQFAADFNRRPFLLDHNLDSHPAFTMDRLHDLLERSLPIPNKVYWNAGKKAIGQKWKDRPGRDFSIEEAFRRIRETDAWIIIFGADRDPEIHALLEKGLAEVQAMTGIPLDKEAKSSQSIMFITSPHRITEYHIDKECSLLLQIHGKKTIHIFDQTDREVLPETELERFWTNDNNAAIYKPELQGRATSFVLEPGKAVHIPINAPHWLENGDDISVSINQNFEYRNEKLANIYRANYYARKMGLSPLPPGRSHTIDRIKAQGMRLPVFMARQAVTIKENRERKKKAAIQS